MKMNRSLDSGSSLIVALVTAGILGVMLASYLRVVSQENMFSTRSQIWNLALPIAEAGVEEGLTQLQYIAKGLSTTGNGWTYDSAAKFYSKSNSVGDSYYSVAINLSSPNNPVVVSEGFMHVPATSVYVSRKVQVTATRSGLFAKGMVAKGQVDFAGNNVETDSFDSADPNYSTNGRYDPNKAKDNGDVATNSGLVNSLNDGNGTIQGHAGTGPGGSVAIGPNGAIGDAAWVDNHTGIQAGHVSDDMNVDFPDVQAPYAWAGTPVNGTVGGTNYTYVLGAGNYMLSSLSMSGQNVMMVTNNAVLLINGSMSMEGQSQILIATNASLTVYVNGTADLSGNGVMNLNANATNFTFYGMSNCTSLKLSGNAAFTGVIYAPNAAFTLGGGGNTIYDFVGASVTGSVKMNGHYHFHYDENLGRLKDNGLYKIIAWREI